MSSHVLIFYGVARFSRPHLVAGFRKRRNPVTRYGQLGHFGPKKVSLVNRDTRPHTVTPGPNFNAFLF